MRIPERVVFKAWVEAGRVRDEKRRGKNAVPAFSVETAAQQWEDQEVKPAAMVFAREILKWAKGK